MRPRRRLLLRKDLKLLNRRKLLRLLPRRTERKQRTTMGQLLLRRRRLMQWLRILHTKMCLDYKKKKRRRTKKGTRPPMMLPRRGRLARNLLSGQLPRKLWLRVMSLPRRKKRPRPLRDKVLWKQVKQRRDKERVLVTLSRKLEAGSEVTPPHIEQSNVCF